MTSNALVRLKQVFPLVLAIGIWFAPVPAGLTAPAWHLFAVFVSAIASVLVGERSVNAGDTDAQIRLVKDRLENWSEPWLLVFDNYDDPKNFPNVKRYIPIGRRSFDTNALSNGTIR